LTELPNRRLLYDQINHAIAALSRDNYYGAVLFIDLDNFKTLNDSLGHDFGDLLLIEVAHRLLECTRLEDTVARLGGDEFVVLLDKLTNDMEKSALQSKIVSQKIIESINQPFILNGYECYSSPSIGIKLFQGHDNSVDELIKHADTAMYESKRSGRNTLRFFNADMQKAMDNRSKLESALRTALLENQFELFFQLQRDNFKGIVGAEVLLRWHQPGVGNIPSSVFISIAEENGLIVSIGNWVLQYACEQLKKWESKPLTKHLQLAINVSYHQFNHPDFINTVEEILEKYQINPGKLQMELTESILPDNFDETTRKMKYLKSLGISFSIDDFGTGYSALARLKQLPIDQLKIDQSFIHDLGQDVNSEVIVKTIIAMANNLGIDVIAEGVETEQQFSFLKQNNCHLFQGYFFSRPLALEQFERKISHNMTRS
jgi:diguanylate cyclase (GGDEF)-like protein